MKKISVFALSLLVLLMSSVPSFAHFQMVLPGSSIVTGEGSGDLDITLKFTHPFEGHDMNMEKPVSFGVYSRGKNRDLLANLSEISLPGGLKAWSTGYTVNRPGDMIFYTVPQPYWEPAEDKYIIHDTKVVVNAFGMESGWDEPCGLRAEIIPLTRPYGLWAGNVFQGRVIVDGKPVPGAEVEVEYYNDRAEIKAPSDAFITQVVKTDRDGVFTYSAPFAGWWGFAALTDAPEKMRAPDGHEVSVELGAVMWVEFSGDR